MCILCVAALAAEPLGAAAIAPSVPSSGRGSGFIVAGFVRPVLFSFLGLKFYSYGVFVAAACLLAFLVFGQEILRARVKIDEMTCFFIFLAGFGIGSKLHVVLSAIAGGSTLGAWDTFISFIDLRNGHSFMGSIIGAALALMLYARYNKVNILTFLDVLLPCCLLGHAIGKIGCFLSGDGCYGPPADPAAVPWAMSFPNAMVPTSVPVHPTPLYEMTCSFLVFVVTRWLLPFPAAPPDESETSDKDTAHEAKKSEKKSKKKDSESTTVKRKDDGNKHIEAEGKVCAAFPRVGRRTALLLVLYGIERVILEHFRRHPPVTVFGGLSEYQAIAVLLLCIGGVIELYSRMSESHAKVD